MSKLIDADAVVAMLRKESREFAIAAEVAIFDADRKANNYTSLAYAAAADQVEKMASEQADGSVPADKC